MSVDESLMCSFQILQPAEKSKPLTAAKSKSPSTKKVKFIDFQLYLLVTEMIVLIDKQPF